MKVLHSALLARPVDGIVNQMLWEQEAAEELNEDWHTRLYLPSGTLQDSAISHYPASIIDMDSKKVKEKIISWFRLRYEYHQWLHSVEDQYDVLLLRYLSHDPFQWAFLRKARKPIFLVHHTLEVPELASKGGLKGCTKSLLERFIGRMAIPYARGIIGVTGEIVEYEKKRSDCVHHSSFIYPNGIPCTKNAIANNAHDVPEILFVASHFASWHGVDLLLSAMNDNHNNFVLHLVGSLSQRDKSQAELDPRVMLHGRLSHEQIRRVAEACSLGLSSFALERKHMKEACTLKVREYLAMGLPVYAGYQDIFPPAFPYYRKGPCSINLILEYANKFTGTERQLIADAARPFIDKSSILNNVIQFLRNDLKDLNLLLGANSRK